MLSYTMLSSIVVVILIKFINSERVFSSFKKMPEKADVVVEECCFCTPLICMQRCCASITTATPFGFKTCLVEQSFISSVNRSCTCNLLAKTSTILGILLKPYNVSVWYVGNVCFSQKKATYGARKGSRVQCLLLKPFGYTLQQT